MKRFLTLLLAFLLVFSFAGCRGSIPADEPSENEITASEPSQMPGETESGPEASEPVCVPTVVTCATADPLNAFYYGSGHPLLSCLYLPLQTETADGVFSSVLSDIIHLGALRWQLVLFPALADYDGNTFTAEDLAALLRQNPLTASVEVVDALTVDFQLATDRSNALSELLCSTYAVSEAALASPAGKLGYPAGFGPYRLESTGSGSLTLMRNEACPENETDPAVQAAADKLILRFGVSPDEQAKALAAGDLDAALNVPADSFAYSSFSINRTFSESCHFLVFNPNAKYSIYGAVTAQLDKTTLAESANAIPSCTLFPEGFPGAPETTAVPVSEAFPKKVKKLTLLCTPDDEALANAVAGQLSVFSVPVTVTVCDSFANAGSKWDLAVVTVSAANAGEALSRLLAPEEGKKAPWFGVTEQAVLDVAAYCGSAAGNYAANVQMLSDWLVSEGVVCGLTGSADYSACRMDCGAVITAAGNVLPGTVQPKPAE